MLLYVSSVAMPEGEPRYRETSAAKTAVMDTFAAEGEDASALQKL